MQGYLIAGWLLIGLSMWIYEIRQHGFVFGAFDFLYAPLAAALGPFAWLVWWINQ